MDSASHRDLSTDECRALLRPGGIGRVGVSVSALPAIFPIRYAMLDDDIVFRISSDGMRPPAVAGTIVAFEADALDDSQADVWSVLVVGRAQTITDRDRIEAAIALLLAPWANVARDSFARISCERISGRSYCGSHLFMAGCPRPEMGA